ncbi:hypothetical protein ABFS83_07G028700 [Erythranthe nasuta]
MFSLEKSNGHDQITSPRISFSSDFLDESNFITICPNQDKSINPFNSEFEFLSSRNDTSTNISMSTADELFCEGMLLPSKLNRINLMPENIPERGRISWFVDDDPSPRPPKCTVLWKVLLTRLKKQHGPTNLSESSRTSPGDHVINNKEKCVKRVIKKLGQEKKRSISGRVRPVLKGR